MWWNLQLSSSVSSKGQKLVLGWKGGWVGWSTSRQEDLLCFLSSSPVGAPTECGGPHGCSSRGVPKQDPLALWRDRAVPYRHSQNLKAWSGWHHWWEEGREVDPWGDFCHREGIRGKSHVGPCFQPLLRPGFLILPPTDCVVLASSPEATETSHLLQLRVQGKEKHQTLEVSLSRVSRKDGSPRISPFSLLSFLSFNWRWIPPSPDSLETLPSLVSSSWIVLDSGKTHSVSLPSSGNLCSSLLTPSG